MELHPTPEVASTPLKVTVPTVVPKFVPLISSHIPTGPELGLSDVIVGGGMTVNAAPLLAFPPTVTATFPLVAPLGTGTVMLMSLQLAGVAAVPLKLTMLELCTAPKLVPVIVTGVPTSPDAGLRLLMPGVTVKFTPLLTLGMPPTVTLSPVSPAATPLGTETMMLVSLQLVGVAVIPPIVTVLAPCVAPNSVPVMVTSVPTRPEEGFRLETPGVIVMFTPLLATPPTVTTTVAGPAELTFGTPTRMLEGPQVIGAAGVPLNVTVLEPCVAPKFAPLIVMPYPTREEVGVKKVMLGAGGITVKPTPLLATPPTVTTTFPVVAPVGTGTTMLVALQLVGVAATPLNVTVLVPCDAPKFVPAIVTGVPTGPEGGVRLVMLGGRVPLAALNAANMAPPLLEIETVALTETVPAIN